MEQDIPHRAAITESSYVALLAPPASSFPPSRRVDDAFVVVRFQVPIRSYVSPYGLVPGLELSVSALQDRGER